MVGHLTPTARACRLALRHAADSARQAVAHPVEGTVLIGRLGRRRRGRRAAEGRLRDGRTGGLRGSVHRAGRDPGQLAVLGRAGVVDAGGRGLVAVLAALVETFTGEAPGAVLPAVHARVATVGGARRPGDWTGRGRTERRRPTPEDCADAPQEGGPAFEVIYLLEAEDAAMARLRKRLDALGDSLVVVGGDGLWNVHVHVDDAGAAVEAGVEAGRPYRIRITHFGLGDVHTRGSARPPREPSSGRSWPWCPARGWPGCTPRPVRPPCSRAPGSRPRAASCVDAVRRAHAREVVLLPNDADLRHTAAAAAEQARAEGIRVALIPTRSAVQGIAALAVHEPGRRFDEDVVSMTSAAGATRYAEVAVAERQSWTMAGICQAGDVLGLIEGDVAVIGSDVTVTAETVLDRMLQAGGELVTLVLGDEAPESVADHLEARVRESYLAVDTVVYRGGRQGALLLIGVE